MKVWLALFVSIHYTSLCHSACQGNPPQVQAVNFVNQSYHLIIEGSNITLTTKTTTSHDSPKVNITWTESEHDLPPTAKVINCTINEELISNLSLYNLSYNDDSGYYIFTASNECGTSFVIINIQVKKADVKCGALKIIRPPQNLTTVSGEYTQMSCLFQGNLDTLDLSITSYWTILLPSHHKSIPIHDNTNPYHIDVSTYSTYKDSCNFTSQITISSVSLEFDSAKFTCVETLQEINQVPPQKASSTLTVLNTPKIIDNSNNKICKTVNDSVSLYCLFNTDTMKGATIVVWLKDHSELTDYDNDTRRVQGEDDKLISVLKIRRVSDDDQGIYNCYCYYNRSIVTSDKTVRSNQAAMYLNVGTDCSAEKEEMKPIVTYVILGCILVAVLLVMVYVIRKSSKRCHITKCSKNNDDSSSELSDTGYDNFCKPVASELPAPNNVRATALSHSSVKVTWDPLSDATEYIISYSTSVSHIRDASVAVNDGDTTSHTLKNLEGNTTYIITLQATTRDGRQTALSTEMSVTTHAAVPGSPPQSITIASIDPASLKVSWEPPMELSHNVPITGYVIQYVKGGTQEIINEIKNSREITHTISGLVACAKYSVKVAAMNDDGIGPFSEPEVGTSGKGSLEAPPTLHLLNHYDFITRMALHYYNIGLELRIDDSQLSNIHNDSRFPSHEEKCRQMLAVWLKKDTSATWEKLCKALEINKHDVLARDIRKTIR